MYVKVRAQKESNYGKVTDFHVRDDSVEISPILVQDAGSIQLSGRASKHTGGYFNAETNYTYEVIISAGLIKNMFLALAGQAGGARLFGLFEAEKANLLKLVASTLHEEKETSVDLVDKGNL